MISNLKVSIEEPEVALYTDIVYTNRTNQWRQAVYPMKLHLMQPLSDSGEQEKFPLLIYICGGAWKDSTPFCQIPWLSYFARRGYVVATIDYRVTGMEIFPAQIQDVKAAIRYLRVHAKEYSIDPERVAVMGDSAGGHLAALAGSSGDQEDFGTPDYPEVSCGVTAVVDLYGPADLLVLAKTSDPADGFSWQSPESLLLGGHPSVKSDLAKIASPITYLGKETPPFLILHGTEDHTVNVEQSELLYEALERVGACARLVELEGADHGTAEFIQPAVQELILDFLNKFV